jgi:hypothetical protein
MLRGRARIFICPNAEAQHQTMTNILSTQPRVSAALLPVSCPLKCFQTLYAPYHSSSVNASNYAPRSRGGRRTGRTRRVTHRFDLSPPISQLRIVDDRRDHPMMTPNQPLQGESSFGDSSGLLFSLYSKAAEDEDNKMVDRWQKDAEGILFFVSPRVGIRLSLY